MKKPNKKRGVECKPIKPPFAIKMHYSQQLYDMLHKYLQELIKVANNLYDGIEAKVVFDNIICDADIVRSISNKLTNRFARIGERYKSIFRKLPIHFINKVNQSTIKSVDASIKETIPDEMTQHFLVNFSTESKHALIAKQALIKDNVNLITNISNDMQERIITSVNESIMRGRDHTYLKEQLTDISDGRFSEKRLKLIARDQIDKASSVIDHARLTDLGIKKAIWKHSKISKVPRQSHKHANNKVYEIDKGCKIDGEYIFPAQLPGCNCYMGPYIEF
jgi:hypothetical protein